ncbi:hypothetical protein G3A43_08645 [Paraburkholderia aspalathi]|nr:hypothetical protein [Paraburkholderia aspalathi]MBK3780325.1 hypothetical protein [Paraburkholderia aspalathi]
MTDKTRATLGFKRIDDEAVDVFVNGEDIGRLDHDSIGWAGMEAAEKLLTKMAKLLGAEIVEL